MKVLNKLIEKIYLKQEGNLVYYDSLTTCKTRSYYDLVAKKKYQSEQVLLVFIDINNLKVVNDTYGHYYGSDIIRKLAHELISIKNRKDSNIFDIIRYGGDEFILIADRDVKVVDIINKLNSDIAYGWYIKERYEDVSSAVSKADSMMYKNKADIKNNRAINKDNLKTYYCTFKCSHPYAKYVQPISADSINEAKLVMFNTFGNKWNSIYDETEFSNNDIIRYYGRLPVLNIGNCDEIFDEK